MDIIGIIPARYSSTRFEGKVIADLLGKPMIQHVWERAKESRLLDDVIIACDDERVADVAEGFGAQVILTARAHSSGSDRICEVINPLDVKFVVNIQGDEPLIHPAMIDSVAGAFLDDEKNYMVSLMRKIDDPEQITNPNVVKVVVDRYKFALYFSRAPIPCPAPSALDLSPILYYKHIGLYGYTKDFLFTYKNLPDSRLEEIEKLEQLRVLEAGFRIKMIETKYDTHGVDTPEDLEVVKQYLQEKRT